MPDTHGFDVVAELTPAALLKMLDAAWETDLLPKNLTVGPQSIGGFGILGAQAQVPESGLGVTLVPNNTLNMMFEVQIQVQLANPPVPSASIIGIDAQVSVPVPVGSLPGKQDVALLFDSLPPADPNNVTLIGGDPIEPHLQEYITEFVHQQFQADGPAFPHTFSQTGQDLILYSYDADLELFDIQGDPAHEIDVAFPINQGQQQLQILIPLHLKIFNIQSSNSLAPPLLSPMGIEARLVLTTNLVHTPGSGSISADLSAAQVTVQGLVPAGSEFGVEGPNSVQNRSTLSSFVNLDNILASSLQSQGQAIVSTLQPVAFTYPKPGDIQLFIAQQVQQTLQARGATEIWPGMAAVPPQFQVTSVATTITPDVLIIAINANPGSDITQIGSFVPAGDLFAIAISGPKTLSILNASIKQQFPTFPVTLHNVDGHDVKLKSLNPSLTNAIHFSGDLTAINVILGSIDVDASFDVDVGLEWQPPDANGLQLIKPDVGSPDVHLSGLAWLLAILVGFITFGVAGAIVGIVVILVVQNIASNIGSTLVVNEATQAVVGIGAWPSPIDAIGDVQSAFDKTIVISPDGLLFTG